MCIRDSADSELHNKIGHVTSGSVALTVGGSVGLGYVSFEQAKIDNTIYIDIRNKSIKSTIVKGAFYKKKNT